MHSQKYFFVEATQNVQVNPNNSEFCASVFTVKDSSRKFIAENIFVIGHGNHHLLQDGARFYYFSVLHYNFRTSM